MPNFKELVSTGIEHNVLCYDYDAKAGELTTRLLDVMTVVMLKHLQDELITVYVSKKAKIDFKEHWDITVKYQDETQYFDKAGGSLIKNNLDPTNKRGGDDKYLVIGIGKKNNVILGSC